MYISGMSGDATSDSFNGEAEQYKDGKGEQNDKCVEAKAVCPKPDGNDKCVESNTTEATEFKPKGDLDSCCPTYNCTKADGSYHIHFGKKQVEEGKCPCMKLMCIRSH